MKIPKKIHYCWFGGKPLPELAEKCIASWKSFFPDYEIIRWDESNYDVNKISYTKEAYIAQKYAFVSDYARFDILYHHGGVYFDTDVEIIKDMSAIIESGTFMGCEIDYKKLCGINSGIGLGANQGGIIFKKILADYKDRHFIKSDGSTDQTTVVDIVTAIFVQHGFDRSKQEIQRIADVTIYPPKYFCPRNGFFNRYKLSKDTYSIHHYAASWMSTGGKLRAAFSKIIGYETYNSLKRLLKNNPNTKR